MAKQSSVNLDITNNPDGFDISGGTTLRKLSVTGGDVTIAGSGGATVTFPTTSTTIAGLGIVQTFSALQSFSVGISANGATFSGNISAPNIVNSLNGFTGAVQATGSGAVVHSVSGTTTTFGARLSTATVTGVASFDPVFFSVGTTGHIRLAAAYQATGSGIATVPLATTSLTGTASFNPNRFQVSATGNVDLLAAFQVTGQTVVSGGPSLLVSTSGNTVTVDNRIATSSVTGVASFNATRFTVSAAGAVDLAAAFQATGDTIVAGSAINLSTSGTTKTINNIGVTSFNGATGAVTFTVPLATTSLTGTASFNPNRFQVSATGNVDLLAAFQVTGQTVVSGGASQLVSTSGNTVTIDNRVATASLTGVASFSGTFFTVSATGSVQLAAAYQATGSGIATVPLATTSLTGTASFNPNRFQVSATGNVDLLAAFQVTGDTIVAGSAINFSTSGTSKTINNIGVTSVNGFTGAVQVTGSGAIVQTVSGTTTTFGARLSTSSVTGVASFRNTHFTVDTTGHVQLATAYQVTGQTVVSGGASQLVSTSGNTVTIDNRVATASLTGVASFSGTFFTVSATGSVQLAAAYQATGSGIATVPLATTSLTGTASFNPNRFQVSATGNVDLLAAYQATGDTVITVAGSGIGISTSGKTDTLFNIGVTAFNGLTGNVSLTGDGGAVQGKSNNTITTRLASTSLTGVASFNNVHFTVDTTGHVKLGAAYQVTGQTVVSGGASQLVSTSGNTVTIDNRVASTSVTGVAAFNATRFTVSAAGAVDLASAFQVTGDTIQAGSFINIGAGKTINNIGVQTLNGATGAVVSIATTGSNVFTGLNTFNAGLSASGATFSGDIAVQGGDITTTSATATVFNTTATTLSIGNAATSWTMGATSGTAIIRNPTLTLGNTTSTITTNIASGNLINIAPYGSVYLAPSTQSVSEGSMTFLIVTDNTDGAGQVQIGGGDLYLSNKSDGFVDTPVNIIFEGSTDNANDTTLTVVNPTATRTITLPDASGTVALTNTTVASINGFTGAVQVTGSGAVVHSVSGTTTTLGARLASISLTGVASFNNVHFTVDTTGHVKLGSAYQVTGQTIVAGNNISTTTSGNTVTLNVTAGGASNAIQFNSNGTLTGNSNFTYDPSTGETIITANGSARSVSIIPGPDSFVQSNGNSALNLMGGNGGIGIVRMGDVNGNGDGTTIEVNDGTRTIALSSSDYLYASAAYTILTGDLVASGATFSGNISVGGNSTLGNAATDTTTIYGAKIVNEGVYANGSLRTANISFANGQVQTLTGVGTGATGITAIYFTSAPSTGAASVTAIITNGGLMTGAGMTSWGGNIKWPGGTKPVLTSSGVDVVSFVTPDAGTTIYGFVGGLGFS